MFEDEIQFIRSLYPGREFIPLHEPCFVGREKEYVAAAIDSTFVSSVGRYVDIFEEMICSFTGAEYATAVVNGTAALHTALVALGVKTNDEVITQSLTFVATTNAIAYCGAAPVFLDVGMDTLGLSPDAIERFCDKNIIQRNGKAYNKNTGREISACVPVHIFGHPCRIDQIVDICSRYKIPVLEDCAESLGSFYQGKHTGRFGSCGVFSLNGNKIITSGGGGVIITHDKDLAEKIRHISTTARVKDSQDFIHDRIGFNYRMPNLNAALACAQMEQLSFFIENKRMLASTYNDCFDRSELKLFKEPPNSISNYWLNAVITRDKKMRTRFLDEADRGGIMVRPVWRLMNRLPMYEKCWTDSLKNASWLEDRIVNIPSSVRT